MSAVPVTSIPNKVNEASFKFLPNQRQQQKEQSKIPTVLATTMTITYDLVIQHIETHLSDYMIVSILVAILIYFIYYLNFIAQKPKLITNNGSKFGHFVKENFNDVLTKPFYPIFFFWGCNFQTALFGYMQGFQSEVPKNEFIRQYLDVSDEQYYSSNVDLDEFFQDTVKPKPSKFRLVKNNTPVLDRAQHQYQQNLVNNSNGQHGTQKSTVQCALENSIKPTFQNIVLKPLTMNVADQKLSKDSMSYSRDSVIVPSSDMSSVSTTASTSSLSSSLSSVLDDSGNDTGRYHRIDRLNERHHSSVMSEKSSADSDKDSYMKNYIGADKLNNRSRFLKKDPVSNDITLGCQQYHQQAKIAKIASSSSSTSSSMSERTENCQIEINSSCSSESCGCMLNFFTPKQHYVEYGQCALDWYKASHKNYHNNQLVALVSAGMTTGSDKIYVTETVKCLNELGYEVCVFIRRGVDGLSLKSARFFSPSKWKDLEAAIEFVKLQRTNAKIVAIGFSFGAIEVCRYLSMTGKKSLVDAAMLISCPYSFEIGGQNMRTTYLKRLLDKYIVNYLGRMLYLPVENRSILDNSEHQIDFSALTRVESLYEFEDHINRIMQYYPTTEAYSKDGILTHVIENIQVPTLCLSSSDDFMATKSMLPLEQIAAHDKVAMILTKHGGHMAFVDGIWPRAPFFCQRILERYFKVLKHSCYLNYCPTRYESR